MAKIRQMTKSRVSHHAICSNMSLRADASFKKSSSCIYMTSTAIRSFWAVRTTTDMLGF